MSDQEIRLCVDCANLVRRGDVCIRTHHLTGLGITRNPETDRESEHPDACGYRGKFFAPKEEEGKV